MLVCCIDPIGVLVKGRAYLVIRCFGPALKTGLTHLCVITNDPHHTGPPEDFVFDFARFKELKINV